MSRGEDTTSLLQFHTRYRLFVVKDKYGDDVDDGSSSSEEEVFAPVWEKDWLKTLAALKAKDPKIYDNDYKFFNENEGICGSCFYTLLSS